MIEVIKTPGNHIKYTTNQKLVTFGDEDLTINLKNREMDEPTVIDICSDKQGFLVIGAETGFRYVAQVEIPARKYSRATGQAEPFDINRCTIHLWGMEA